MNHRIGTVAGNIWQQLEKGDEITPKQLSTAIKEKSDVVYLALGWLAREDKIEINPTKSTFKVKISKD
jgi:hypothetical protein